MSLTQLRKTLVIVPCGRAKIWAKRPDAGAVLARDAYIGSPFKVNRAYAERFGDDWLILSAKYGFLAPADTLPENYNVTFKRPRTNPIAREELRRQVAERGLDRYDEVVGLGGREYRTNIEYAFALSGVEVHFP